MKPAFRLKYLVLTMLLTAVTGSCFSMDKQKPIPPAGMLNGKPFRLVLTENKPVEISLLAFSNDSTGVQDTAAFKIKPKKIIAITLAVTLGVFGVHRLYLGTATKVPIIYTVTLGGFGVLPLSDIIAIIATRKWDVYFFNDRVFMWAQ